MTNSYPRGGFTGITAPDEDDRRVFRGPHATETSDRFVSSGVCLNRRWDGVVVAAEAMECLVWARTAALIRVERGE